MLEMTTPYATKLDCCSLLCALRAQHHLQLQHQLLWQPRDQKQIAQQGAGEPLQQCEPALVEVMENPSQWHQYVLLLASFEMRSSILKRRGLIGDLLLHSCQGQLQRWGGVRSFQRAKATWEWKLGLLLHNELLLVRQWSSEDGRCSGRRSFTF